MERDFGTKNLSQFPGTHESRQESHLPINQEVGGGPSMSRNGLPDLPRRAALMSQHTLQGTRK